MNAQHSAKMAYAGATRPIRTKRGTEYEIFARITAKLSAAVGNPQGFADLANALHENRKLWTCLAANVAEDANDLPPGLRAQIFYLAEFTHKHSGKVLSGTEDAQVLVDINAAIMRGLRGMEVAA